MRKIPSHTIHDFGVRCAEDNKAYMLAYMRQFNAQKITCCGMEIYRGTIAKHRRTKGHKT